MKTKGFIRKAIVVILTLLVLLSSISFTSAAEFVKESELPIVQKWVNGAAMSSDGSFLRDTWAVDKSGISESKYVLVSQESSEVFRVNKYPDDISAGATIALPVYTANITLTAPETLTGEINVTFENDSAVYTLSFTEEKGYVSSGVFYPGQYKITGVEATAYEEAVFQLSETETLTVAGENLSVSYELQRVKAQESEDATENADESDGVDVVGIVSGFDSDGDLLPDTIKLLVAVAILFIVYGFIKYRRKKKEEINR